MSSLTRTEQSALEKLFAMSNGYVCDFSDRTLGDFMTAVANVNIHDQKYQTHGTSKAKKLREFWKVEQDYRVGESIMALVGYVEETLTEAADPHSERKSLIASCKAIASRLMSSPANLEDLKQTAVVIDAGYLSTQIQRMEYAIPNDPELAIGTAKEIIETCCKTILAERGKPVTNKPEIPALTRETFKELRLTSKEIPDDAKGAQSIRQLLQNLAVIGANVAQLRNAYGSGHGQEGKTKQPSVRLAKLATGAAATLSTFLFDTHKETMQQEETAEN